MSITVNIPLHEYDKMRVELEELKTKVEHLESTKMKVEVTVMEYKEVETSTYNVKYDALNKLIMCKDHQVIEHVRYENLDTVITAFKEHYGKEYQEVMEAKDSEINKLNELNRRYESRQYRNDADIKTLMGEIKKWGKSFEALDKSTKLLLDGLTRCHKKKFLGFC
jgi:hypothetical protein